MARPNIVLITVECWRGDSVGLLTPALSALGEESVVFSDAQVAGGWTLPSMTALMSSAWASMHGGPLVAMAAPTRKVLPECLLGNGYWTAGITANGVCGTVNGFQRGFGWFRQLHRRIPPHLAMAAEFRHEWKRLAEMGIPPGDLENFSRAHNVTETACDWLRRQDQQQPYFLWLHYLDPHWPYLTDDRPSTSEQIAAAWNDRRLLEAELQPSRGRYDAGSAGERWVKRYREALRITDAQIGRLLTELRERTDWDRTIVVATGDHGEEFFEHGTWLHQWNQLHREGIHVPMIMRIPGVPPQTVAAPVSHLDLAPTLLDYAGIDPPAAMRGSSLRRVLDGKSESGTPLLTEMLGHPGSSLYAVAIRDGQWKYIHDSENAREPKLFNLNEDPGERDNVIGKFPQLYRKFEQIRLNHFTLGVVRLMSRKGGLAEAARTDDEAVRDQLQALGYL